MLLEDFITILIVIHAIAGGIALLTGSISIFVKKGGEWHKKAGMIFYYNMLVLGFLALIISWMPGHINYFLFMVGVFSMYLVLAGKEAMKFKKIQSHSQLKFHKVLSAVMLFFGVGMFVLGSYLLIAEHSMGTALLVFGVLGCFRAIMDFRSFRDLKKLRKSWLRHHIGKMSGGLIAAFTAFIVVNEVFSPLVNWLLPTVFGTIFITYWTRRVSPKKKVTVQPKKTTVQ